MSEHRTLRLTRPKRSTVLALILVPSTLLLLCVSIHIYFRNHIEGVYYDPYMACDCSYVFKDGKIFMDTDAGRDALGTFKRVGTRWVCPGLPSSKTGKEYLESSLIGVTWFDKGFESGEHFLPRSSLGVVAEFLYRHHIRI